MAERIELIGPIVEVMTGRGPMTAAEIKGRLKERHMKGSGVLDVLALMRCVFVNKAGETTVFRRDGTVPEKCARCDYASLCPIVGKV
jgi:hypothetical protein